MCKCLKTAYLAESLDCKMLEAAMSQRRREIIPSARGRVVEIGSGSGLNFPLYSRDVVTSIIGVEPEENMRALAKARIAQSTVDVDLVDAMAEDLPIQSGSADTVVATNVLCSITGIRAAMSEIRRVLKQDGRLLFIEHGKADQLSTQILQHVLTPFWRTFRGGCRLNRDVPKIISNGGFKIENIQAEYLPGLRWEKYYYWGCARIN